jgi:hypothetical protein
LLRPCRGLPSSIANPNIQDRKMAFDEVTKQAYHLRQYAENKRQAISNEISALLVGCQKNQILNYIIFTFHVPELDKQSRFNKNSWRRGQQPTGILAHIIMNHPTVNAIV